MPDSAQRPLSSIHWLKKHYWTLGHRLGMGAIDRTAIVSPQARINGKRSSVRIGAYTQLHPHAVLSTVPGGGSISVGKQCEIHIGALILSYGGRIEIADNCSFNPYCVIYGHGGLTIGTGVRIAAQTVIIPSNHRFDDLEVPIHKQGETSLGIHIEDDVWIGTGVKVLDGVTIGRGAVIGAGSVVTKSIDRYSIAVGVPCRPIRSRIK